MVAFNKKSVTIKTPAKPDRTKGQQAFGSTGTVKKEADPWASYQHSDEKGKQQALKERLAKKYNRPDSGSSGAGDILSRAKASVEEDFGQTWEQEEEARRKRLQEEADHRQRKQEELERRQRIQEEARRKRMQEDAGRQRKQKEAAWQQARGQRGQAGEGGWKEPQEPEASLVPFTEGMFLDGGLSLSPGMPVYGQQESMDMGAVYDLMAKGPDLELAFERDFIAEGLEMLNRIQA